MTRGDGKQVEIDAPRQDEKRHIAERGERAPTRGRDDPKHAKAMAIARRGFRDYVDTFRALAE